jgi:hypothetical protein
MSVVKLLSRIVAPKISEKMTSEEKMASKLHGESLESFLFLLLLFLCLKLPLYPCL